MEIYLVRTSLYSLSPAYAEDQERMNKMRFGVPYRCELKLPRNYAFHQKFFALVNTAYSFLPEEIQIKVGGTDGFRQELLLFAGVVEKRMSFDTMELYAVAKSISFASMDEAEFSDTYELCVNCVYRIFTKCKVHIDQDVFYKHLANF